ENILELGILPSSTIHCVYPQVVITEPEQLDSGSVQVNWNYFQAGNIWPYYVAEFGMDNMSADLELSSSGDLFIANVGDNCIDLWPDADLPGRTQLNGVSVQFWISGHDSAGYGISQGGDFGEAIISTTTVGTSSYEVVYEQAEFTIGAKDVRMYPSAPEVGQDIELDITLRNTGNIAGNISLDIFSNTGGVVQLETTITTAIIGIGEDGTEKVTIEAFDKATTGVSFEIRDNETGEALWNGLNAGETFSIKVAAEESEGGMVMIILAGLGGLILILLVVVAVLVMRGRDDDEGTEFYDDYLDDDAGKAYPEMPSGPPVAAAGISPEMQQALQEFPQWNQEQIQGYLDQGWSVEALRDWVNSN
ncbi:MAG: hypothetical protein NZ770_05360, partial [Candidatus Poseidoniaceae archaeon]|nr:hypothetical protein [Candidatus Poseidoniaceae archaeon]